VLRAVAGAPVGTAIVAVVAALLDTVGAAALLRRGTMDRGPHHPLAMADAGRCKTAFNLDDNKNRLAPSTAAADAALAGFTAPAPRLTDGLAEALKHAWLTGAALEAPFDGPSDIARWVRQSVAVKAGVVMRDPREHGLRTALNLGHTIGHAIERVANLSHGEAVRRGLLAALWLSERLKARARATVGA
jgi:3-dehydroquinate synthase